jgi:hypothetical protein
LEVDIEMYIEVRRIMEENEEEEDNGGRGEGG